MNKSLIVLLSTVSINAFAAMPYTVTVNNNTNCPMVIQDGVDAPQTIQPNETWTNDHLDADPSSSQKVSITEYDTIPGWEKIKTCTWAVATTSASLNHNNRTNATSYEVDQGASASGTYCAKIVWDGAVVKNQLCTGNTFSNSTSWTPNHVMELTITHNTANTAAINETDTAIAAVCQRARDRSAGVRTSVYNSYAKMEVGGGNVKGLANKFCVFQNSTNSGMIDLQTLGSKQPSIAATYLLKGLDLGALPHPGTSDNPGTFYCKALEGSSISRYAMGGFLTPNGVSEICVFGDGSKVGIWELIHVSENPDHLSMRKAVKSKALDIALPYINTGN